MVCFDARFYAEMQNAHIRFCSSAHQRRITQVNFVSPQHVTDSLNKPNFVEKAKLMLRSIKTLFVAINRDTSPVNFQQLSTRRTMSFKYLTQTEAINLDRELFDEYAFSVDQLMELAGLSVATVIATSYPCERFSRPIICCGPGNNGGDGLVCARHLKMFGYQPSVICPKQGRGELYQNLLTQCRKYDIPVLNQVPDFERLDSLGDLVIDSVFGFSFKPPNRSQDFAKLLNLMHTTCSPNNERRIPLVSVDIPSGWHVEDGYARLEELQSGVEQEMKIPALRPDCLVSLTAPKLCAKFFEGNKHFLGGRFCPKALEDKFKLNLPKYPNNQLIVELPNTSSS